MVALYNIVNVYRVSIYLHNIIFISVVLNVFFIEIGLTIVFIVGGHMKNVKLMRVFYIYNIVLLVIASILMLVAVLVLIFPVNLLMYHTWQYITMCANFFFSIVTEIYFILLMRSEILKLESRYGFSFVNNAAEGECTMRECTQIEGDCKTIEDEPKEAESVSE